MHINISHNNAQQPFITLNAGLHLPLTSRHKDYSYDSSWYNRQALTTRNSNKKQDTKVNFSIQGKARQNYSFMKDKDDQIASGRSCKIVSNNKLKPCAKPAKVIQLKADRHSQNTNSSFSNNLHYGELFMNKFTPKHVTNRVDLYKNIRNKLSLTIAQNNNKPVYHNPLAVRNSQNSHKSSNNESVRVVNQRIKDLKLSQSIDPIVEPYRDRSTDSYHYGQGYGYGMQAGSNRESPMFQKEDVLAVHATGENLQRESKYFYQNVQNINSLYRNSPNPGINQNISWKTNAITRNKKHIQTQMDHIKQDASQFQQESKQLQKTRKYSEQPVNANQQSNYSPQYHPHRYQSENIQQLKQKKRIFVFPAMPMETLDSKQLKSEELKKYYQQTFDQDKEQKEETQKNKQTQAEKCAKITQLYQPFSMQMSSNRKNNIVDQSANYSITKHQTAKKSSSKKFLQHAETFNDEDKWDRILKMRQLAYQRSEQQNHEIEGGSFSKDKKAGTAFSTAIKHPFSVTPAVSIHQSLQQSQRSYVLNNINSPTSSKAGPLRNQHKISSPINQLNKALTNPIQNSGSHLYSYSYEPSCEYSYLENSHLNEAQRIRYEKQNQNDERQVIGQGRQNTGNNVQSLYNKFKTIAAQYNLQNNTNIVGQQSVYKGQQLTMNEKLPRRSNKDRPSGPEQMTYSYSFEEHQDGEYKYQRELFSKYLHARHIQWMPIFSRMIQHVNNQIQSRIVTGNFQYSQIQKQNNQDQSIFRYREDPSVDNQNEEILITFVKIGDSGQDIYQNRIISHYIGIWLLTMGFDDPEVKERVVGNVELMFTDVDDIKNRQNQQDERDEAVQEFTGIRQIAQLMYNNLLYGYLPADLQLRALLEVCRRGMQYFTFLIIKILKLLMKIGKNGENKHNLMASLESPSRRRENEQETISDQQLHKKLQSLIESPE